MRRKVNYKNWKNWKKS